MVLHRLAEAGWTIREGFAIIGAAWDVSVAKLALFGRVHDNDTAELVLLAAARGAAVVAITDTGTTVGRTLLADLSRIGPVVTDPVAEAATEPAVSVLHLAPEHHALMARLANGETIAAAAAAESISLRTANRRISEARDALGVRTTRDAVLKYLRTRSDN
jgi:hypothetical protein